ncbi:dihydrofolate reductase family protein [Micromonospora globbae]|uniref:dihydrofolate reductase family protein n=1 Tax=Micromonospora globbae TaxID=1894969 RepID=UPI003870E484|nr:dihydrofolate reductase family protein [Micromonospora globbae]
MGEIKAGLFVSLDGVTEAPETWHFPYFDDEMGAAVGALMATDATLFGRVTYTEMAEYWPNADPADPTTAMMNGARKYVVSNTLTSADWENTTLIRGDAAAEELAKLKQDSQIGVTGSVTLVRWLLEQRLLDELHLLVHPIVVGHGKRLFQDGPTVPLKLVSSTAFASGVLHLVYAAADESTEA